MNDHSDGLPAPRRYVAIIAILTSITMTVLDSAMLNVALPGIARDLGISPARATWLLNAYQLAVITTLLPLASLGEILGFRRVFLTGSGVFALAALGASQAPDFGTLLACRIAQGIGASAVMSLTAGLIRFTYPSRQLGRAIGINAMVVACSGAAAPSLAAAILAVGPWRWLFLVDVPVAVIALLVGARALPDPAGTRQPFDFQGAALNILTFGLFFLGMDLLLAATGPALLLMGGGIGAGVLLVQRQLTQRTPLLPLDLLRIRVIAFSVAASVCPSRLYASYVALPFLLQGAGRGQVETGLLMTPWPLAVAFAAPLAGRLSDRVPTALLCAAGMGMMAAGLALLVSLPASGAAVLTGAVVALCGAGFGGFQTPNNRTMLISAPKARSGGAGGMQATARLLGTTLGTTTVALCFQVAGTGGPRLALTAGIGFAVAAGLLSLSRRGVG
ncbi:MAG: MFS transporter [Acetobacteraceae bacterium]|nr:MFS transporter [Acetobacteraceae bacterium]